MVFSSGLNSSKQVNEIVELSKTSRQLAERIFNSYDFNHQLMLVNQAGYLEKKELLFLAEDTQSLIRQLEADDLYQVVKNNCSDIEALILFELGTGDQANYFLDLECWNDDRINNEKFMYWVEFLLECDYEIFRDTVPLIDVEFLAAALKPGIESTSITEEDLKFFEDMGEDYFCTPKNLNCENITTEIFIEHLYSLDHDLFSNICEMIIYDENLEENAYAGRVERMAKRNIPSYKEASLVYQKVKINPEMKQKIPIPQSEGLVKSTTKEKIFLHRALEKAKQEWFFNRTKFQKEFVALLNSVCIADGVFSDDRGRLKTINKVTDLLDIGIRYLSSNCLENAINLLNTEDLTKIFQVGYTLAEKK